MKGCLRRGRHFGRDVALLGKINPIKAYLKIKKKKNVIILRLIISHLMLTLIHPQVYIHDLNAVMGVSSNATQHKKNCPKIRYFSIESSKRTVPASAF